MIGYKSELYIWIIRFISFIGCNIGDYKGLGVD
jgi:hypothetical protein